MEERAGEPWTEKEEGFLEENYQDMTYKEIGKELGRSRKAVEAKTERMDLKKREQKLWSEDEIEFLENNYQNMTYKEIGEVFNRTEKAVEGKVRKLGLDKKQRQDRNKSWSESEVEFLRKNYQNTTYKKIGEKLNRSWQAVQAKARELGLKKKKERAWTEDEIEFLKENYQNMTYKKIGKKLDRNKQTIQAKARKLGLRKRKQEAWTEKELRFLKENYRSMPTKSIAEKLDRTLGTVCAQAKNLGLAQSRGERKDWTEEEKRFLEHNYYDLNYKEIAEKLDRSLHAVRKKANQMGLRKQGPQTSWNKSKILRRLQDLEEKHGKEYLAASNLCQNECGLFGAIYNYFGSLESAVKKAGYDIEEVYERRPDNYWTKERIVKELKRLAKKHGENTPQQTQSNTEG